MDGHHYAGINISHGQKSARTLEREGTERERAGHTVIAVMSLCVWIEIIVVVGVLFFCRVARHYWQKLIKYFPNE